MTFRSKKFGQFSYFSIQLGQTDWSNKDVLDFGGNVGNMLRDPNSTIRHNRYWCVDVDETAIADGQLSYPNAHWYSYDRYCFFFNSNGTPDLAMPDLAQQFDYIVAYSVFTNTGLHDMLDLVSQLRAYLKIGGQFAFTFIDPNYHSWPNTDRGSNLQWRLEKFRETQPGIDIKRTLQKTQGASWFTLVNGTNIFLETDDVGQYRDTDIEQSYFTYYSVPFIYTLFPDATILPPVNNEMQHCCILRE